MKRIRDIFRCPRSFRLRCFRPRCLCGEDDISRCQSVEEVYRRSDAVAEPAEIDIDNESPIAQRDIKLELKAPDEPSGASSQDDLPEPCEDMKTQENLKVPAEPEAELEIEALLDPPEAVSFSDLPEPEQEPHVPTEHELETEIEALPHPTEAELEVEALPNVPEVASLGDFPEPEQEPHVPTELEVENEIETLPHPTEVELEIEVLPYPTEAELEIEVLPYSTEAEHDIEALPNVPEVAYPSDLPEPEQEPPVPKELEVETEIEALSHPPEAELEIEALSQVPEVASLGDLPEPDTEPHVPTELEVETEIEALSHPPDAVREIETLPYPPEVASPSDLPEPEQEPHVPRELEVETEIEALSHSPVAELEIEALPQVPEVASLGDLPEPEPHVPTELEVKTEIQALPHPPEASCLVDFTEHEQVHVPSEPEVKLEIEALLDPPEVASLSDYTERPEDIIIQEEPAQDPEPAVEIPCEPDVKVPDEEENIPQASADGRIQRQFPVSLQDFRCCAVLGEGAFGKVLLAEYVQTQSMFAIKAIKKAAVIKRKFAKNLRYEKEIFQTVSSAHHPFLVNLFASFQDKHYVFFVMEYAAGGDLMSNMAKIADSFPEDRVVFYAACVVLGIECLHQNKIIHRDLKLENIVLDKEGYAKITDFGLSKAGIGFGDRTKSMAGTPDYMAPEMVARKRYTRDVDWWSLGVLVYAMLAAQMPFDDEDRDKLNHQIINCEVSYPQDWSPESLSLVSHLLVKDPAQRLGSGEKGAEDVKAHPFFRDMEWTRLLLRELRPPFLPPLSGPEDVSNFNEDFTSMDPLLTTPMGPGLTRKQQGVFNDFEWTAEWAL